MKPLILLKKNLQHATNHRDRIVDAMEHIKGIVPLSIDEFLNLTSDEKAYLDMLAMRFMKLQDVMGAKIFPLTLNVMKESYDTSRYLDVLNMLEKTKIIDSKEFWVELREFRNYIAHDYPDNEQNTLDAINLLYKNCQELVASFDQYQERIFDILE